MARTFAAVVFCTLILASGRAACAAESEQDASISGDALGKQTPEECYDIDLVSEHLLPIWGAPVSQVPTDWCGSFAVADVLSYWTMRPVSAVQIGALYHRDLQEKNIDRKGLTTAELRRIDADTGYGGRSCDLFDVAKTYGLCARSAVENSDLRFFFNAAEVSRFYQAYRQARDSRPDLRPDSTLPQPERFGSSKQSLSNAIAATRLDLRTDGTNMRRFLAEFVENRCRTESWPLPPALTCRYLVKDGESKLSGETDELLENGTMPVLTFDQDRLYEPIVGQAAPHAVTLNARRWNKARGRCEYRLRNSSGWPECRHYSAAVSCDPKEVAATMEVWIDGAFIDRYGYRLTVIR